MKKLTILIFSILAIATNAFTQAITLQTLIDKSECSDSSCFSEFIMGKGYTYDRSYGKVGNKSYGYMSQKRYTANDKLLIPNYASFAIRKDGSKTLGYTTYEKSQYKILLTELSILKFEAGPSQNEENGTIAITYKSSQYPKIIIVGRTKPRTDNQLGKWAIYDFQIVKNP